MSKKDVDVVTKTVRAVVAAIVSIGCEVGKVGAATEEEVADRSIKITDLLMEKTGANKLLEDLVGA